MMGMRRVFVCLLCVIRAGVWLLCLCWTLSSVSQFWHGEPGVTGHAAPADAPNACVWLIAGYVTARAFDFIIRQIETAALGRPGEPWRIE